MEKPFLEHIVRQVVRFGLTDIFITTHFRAGKIRSYFGDGRPFGARIQYAHEHSLMNTAGSLKLLEKSLHGDFLVIGGNDFLPTINLADLIAYHRGNGGIGTVVLKKLDDRSLLQNFGQAVLDASGKIVSFVEKPKSVVSELIHTTYQIYHSRVLMYIPSGVPCSIPEYMIHAVLEAQEPLYGYVTRSPFVCISTPDQYERSHQQLADALRPPA